MLLSQIPIIFKRAAVAAPAGWTLVQTTGSVSVVNNTAGSVTFTNAFPATPHAGSLLVFCFTYFNTTISSGTTGVTIGGDTGVVAASVQESFAPNYWSYIYYIQSATGTNRNITISFPDASGGYIEGCCEEWTGQTASCLDQVPAGLQTGGTTRTITSGVTSVARELVYSLATDISTFGTGTEALTGPTTGYTQSFIQNAINRLGGAAGYKTTTSTGTQSATFTNSVGGEVDVIMATFKGV